jgi:hypothetical protein
MNFKVSQLKSLTAGEVAVDDLIYVIDSNPTDGSVKSKKVTVGDLIDSRIYGISSSQFVLITGYYADPSWITSLDWSKITNAPSFVTSLSALTDVQLSTPLSGQALVYNGSKWVNQGIGELDTLNSVTTRGNTTTNNITVGSTFAVGDWTSRPTNVYVRAATGGADERGYYIGVGSANNGNGGSLTYNATTNFLSLKSPYNSGTIALSLEGNTNSVQFHNTSGTVVSKFVSSTGNLLIGTTTDAGYKLDVNGTARVTGDTTISTNLSVGLTSAFGRFTVRGADNSGSTRTIVVQNQSQTLIFDLYNNGKTLLNPQGSGNIIIGSTADTNAKLQVYGSITAASLLAQGVYFNNTLVAAANNDVLVGLDINPTFTNGAFTGLKNLSIRVGNSYAPYSSVAYGHGVELNTNVAIQGSLDLGGDSSVLYFWKSGARSNGGMIGETYLSPNFAHLYFGANQTKQMILASTGNLLINTTTDAGYKLDVVGSTRIAESTAGTKLTVTGIDQEDVLLVTWGGTNSIGLGSNTANNPVLRLGVIRFTAHPNGGRLQLSGATGRFGTETELKLYGSVSGTATGTMVWLGSNSDFSAAAHNPTSGTLNVVGVLQKAGPLYAAFNPASGNATFNIFNIDPVINTSGTYAGIVRGFYYNPTLTSITGTTHRAIETTSGDVIFNGGNVGIGVTPTNKLDIAYATGVTNRFISFGIRSGLTADHAEILFTNVSTGHITTTTGSLQLNPFGNSINTNFGLSILQLTASSNYGLYSPTARGLQASTNAAMGFLSANGDVNTDSFIFSGPTGARHFFKVVQNNVPYFTIMPTGNVLINTTTDSGYKLDVNGTARVNNIFYVTNSAYTGNLRIEAFANYQQRIIGAYGENITFGAGGNTMSLNAGETYFSGSLLGGGFWMQSNGNTVIGAQSTPPASALVEIRSTTKGFLQPRLTTAQILAITTPAEGLQVYNTDLHVICFYDGTGWKKVSHSNM